MSVLHKMICCGYSLELPREAILMSTHNICFYGEISKYPKIYPQIPSLSVPLNHNLHMQDSPHFSPSSGSHTVTPPPGMTVDCRPQTPRENSLLHGYTGLAEPNILPDQRCQECPVNRSVVTGERINKYCIFSVLKV